MLVLRNFAFRFVAAYLLIQRIQKLLAGCGAGEGGAVVERSAEATKIKQALRSTIEWHTHAIEQIDDCGRGVAHRFHGRLVGEEIPAINRVVKVLPGRVALALQIFRGVNSTLRADRMRTLDRHDRE